MAQLTLHDMSIQEIERFSEPVLAKKFSRALANACDIDPTRIRVLGFRPGSIKVIFEILPEGIEDAYNQHVADREDFAQIRVRILIQN